jgi:hypothetical protein
MPVVVVRADADHAHPRVDRGQEIWVEVRRAVVRHLQHVGPQVGAGAEQLALGLHLFITRQQDADAGHRRRHRQR